MRICGFAAQLIALGFGKLSAFQSGAKVVVFVGICKEMCGFPPFYPPFYRSILRSILRSIVPNGGLLLRMSDIYL
jgi:hypothetical protein